ncbi:hypothetical protein [Longimicrobium terrae]|uniref:Uncharacterized protein n=1 Tax=Longimicrobium terrae TaxID=1639882 RepID=A0A841GKG3_9BACT|nr:hypothetical protein [Longimicrobium terrae]MBB4634816.1 hypothetical protein [Longimicrobium terrae]MBB6069211.1 hypothetical protein [Longimicrobium terrae]NNC31977.1 hypothetical protein [Longimicrobium terrae]
MKKLSLNLEALVVETFETTTLEGAGRGTVLGRAIAGEMYNVPQSPRCGSPLCVDTPLASCDSCGNSCAVSCNGSCDSCAVTCAATCTASCGADTCAATCARSCVTWCIPEETIAAQPHGFA